MITGIYTLKLQLTSEMLRGFVKTGSWAPLPVSN